MAKVSRIKWKSDWVTRFYSADICKATHVFLTIDSTLCQYALRYRRTGEREGIAWVEQEKNVENGNAYGNIDMDVETINHWGDREILRMLYSQATSLYAILTISSKIWMESRMSEAWSELDEVKRELHKLCNSLCTPLRAYYTPLYWEGNGVKGR